MKNLCLLFTILISTFLIEISPPIYASDVTEGATCADEGTIFLATTSTRTPWAIAQITIASSSSIYPEAWDQYNAATASIAAHVPTDPSIQDYADAVVSVWRNYNLNTANVFVNLTRTINRTDTAFECISGTWMTISPVIDSVVSDDSGWTLLSASPYSTGTASSANLNDDISTLIADLNTQPGA